MISLLRVNAKQQAQRYHAAGAPSAFGHTTMAMAPGTSFASSSGSVGNLIILIFFICQTETLDWTGETVWVTATIDIRWEEIHWLIHWFMHTALAHSFLLTPQSKKWQIMDKGQASITCLASLLILAGSARSDREAVKLSLMNGEPGRRVLKVHKSV